MIPQITTVEQNNSATVVLKGHKPFNKWYYPEDIANDLRDVDLPPAVKAESFACAWEYTRCIIPSYTNWGRYVAFVRTIIIAVIVEFRGDLVDVTGNDNILGYSLDGTLAELFGGTVGHEEMAREFKAFLLITGDKTSDRRDGELFRRYVNTVASSPRNWFRIRDCDALARFSIAAALVCNDLDNVWFEDAQLEMLCEIADTMYDAVAFYKHRTEGEINSTFAYVPEDMRLQAFHVAREMNWALDAALLGRPEHIVITNFMRFFGGPIHMITRRYRFVEDGLAIGKPEDDLVVQGARENVKLWYRIDANDEQIEGVERYRELLKRSSKLMFRGLDEMLEKYGDGQCSGCYYRPSYGATASKQFGSVEICEECIQNWRQYIERLPERVKEAFPDLNLNPSLPEPVQILGDNLYTHE